MNFTIRSRGKHTALAMAMTVLFALAASAQSASPEGEHNTLPAFTLIGQDVFSEDREHLGTVQDLVVLADGSVPYVLVRFTPFVYTYEFGLQLHLIPFSMVDIDAPNQRLFLAHSEAEMLARAAPLDDPQVIHRTTEYDARFRKWWLAEPRYNYDVEIEPGHGTTERDLRALDTPEGTGPATIASVLADYRVTSRENRTIGGVDGILVGLGSGTVEFIGVALPTGFLGLGKRVVPVPYAYVTEMNTTTDRLTTQLSEQAFRDAPAFANRQEWIEATDWEDRVRSYWSRVGT